MGMGEPLMNLDAVLATCERLPDLGIATSHTTISTVGWIPGIERLATEGPRVRLALSLHAPDDALRSELMPVNDRYPLADLLEACLAWRAARKRRIYIEYLMLAGVNDRVEQARALAGLLRPREAFKVNLIPYNPTGGSFEGSSREAIAAFRAALAERGLPATVRLTRGREIAAACGQLAVGAGRSRSAHSGSSSISSASMPCPSGTRRAMSPRPHSSSGQSEVSTASTPRSVSDWRNARAVSRSEKSRTTSQSS